MSPVYFDEDGNEVELDKSIDEIQKSYQEQTQQFEEFKKTKEEEVKVINEKLSKLENKEFNFKALRDMTEEEKGKLSAMELQLKQQQEKHDEEIKNIKQTFIGNAKEEVLNKLAGQNEEVRKKVLEAYDSLNLKDESKADIEARMKAAYKLAVGSDIGTNLSYSSEGVAPIPNKVSDVKPEVKELGKNLGLSDEDFKKYSK
jgi:chromosome segregation ATPase